MLSRRQNENSGASGDASSPDAYMCDSAPLASADTDSVSLQARQMEEISVFLQE